MQVTVLGVPGCPHVPLLEERLAQVLADRSDVTVSREVIATADEAARSGMHGSPTILIDGLDPFAEPGQAASVSCRLYRDSDGRADGAPSVGHLRRALSTAAANGGRTGGPSWLDALGRAGRGRIAPAERGLRAVHQAILRSFAATGHPPDPESLEEAAAPFNASAALAELAAGDFLCLDQAGQVSAAYPFSATATSHLVQITGGGSAYAMCAIDALGIAPMLGASVLISSADPVTGEPIAVTVDGSDSDWRPATAVVFVGRTANECAGPSAAICCSYINFFATSSGAAVWARAHPEIDGGILSQTRALEVGEQIFAQLLR
jgi:Alkylmercury lyase